MEAYNALLVLAICDIGTSSTSDDFYYFNEWFRRSGDEECKLCYGDNDCLSLNQARCEFYTATTATLIDEDGSQDPGQSELRSQVDSLMSDMMMQASTSTSLNECIPMISQYTDCTKENVGEGCTECSCNGQGRWRCVRARRCRAPERLQVDHRALVFALESLKTDGNPSFRLKRSTSAKGPRKPHKVTFEEVAEWMYELKHIPTGAEATTEASPTENITRPTMNLFNNDFDTSTTEPDYVAFSEVLRNIANEAKNKTLNNVTNIENDYMNLEGVNVTYNEVNEFDFDDMTEPRKTNETSTSTDESVATTKATIDMARNNTVEANSTETFNDLNHVNLTLENYTTFDNTNDIDEFNFVNVMKRSANIMKRDVARVSNELVLPISTEIPTKANFRNELDDGVYQPLTNIIRDKQQELEDLKKIREKLNQILNLNQTDELAVVQNKSENVNNSNITHYSFYNVEISPEIEYSLRRANNISKLDTYLKKLNRDIFTVMQDIAVIQRLSMQSVPTGMKGLIHALRRYIQKHGKLQPGRQGPGDPNIDLRRHIYMIEYDRANLKKYLVAILQLIDKDMPQSNALAPLSPKTRKILKRVLKDNKINEYSVLGLRVNDPNYNLTNDLKNIGVSWPAMTSKIENSLPWDQLYHMKMLQFLLESDIAKMNDALALVDFAHSRRMAIFSDDIVSNEELIRIDVNLRSMHEKINKIIEFKNKNKKQEVNNIIHFMSVNKENKKDTFLKHIRNLLKNSKKDIMKLLHKKVPKSDIIKELARKKLDELTQKKLIEYENVMQKWQNNMNIHARQRRSAFGLDLIKTRIKNILPRYLRGKVNPKINSTRNPNKNANSQKKSHRRNKNNNRRKNSTVTIPAPLTNSTNTKS